MRASADAVFVVDPYGDRCRPFASRARAVAYATWLLQRDHRGHVAVHVWDRTAGAAGQLDHAARFDVFELDDLTSPPPRPPPHASPGHGDVADSRSA